MLSNLSYVRKIRASRAPVRLKKKNLKKKEWTGLYWVYKAKRLVFMP